MSDENRFSRHQVQSILRRATELERQDDLTLSEQDLYEIAAEAGIEPAALKRAIEETRNTTVSTSTDSAFPSIGESVRSSLVPAILSSVFGTGSGLAAATVRQVIDSHGWHLETMAAMALVGTAAASSAFLSRGRFRHLAFQLSSLGLWLGFSIGYGIGYPILADDALGVGAIAAAISGILGAFIVAFRNRHGATPGSSEMGTSGASLQNAEAPKTKPGPHGVRRSMLNEALRNLGFVDHLRRSGA